MKKLHRRDLFSWSVFSERLDIDFNAYCWTRPDGNVLIDPLAMTPHDREHLERLGGAAWIVLTNSAHVRGTTELAAALGANVAGPAGEKETFPIPVDRWLGGGEELFPGATVHELEGSKTPGELLLLLGDTLISGDLIRSHRAGALTLLLPEQGLKDRGRAVASIARLPIAEIDAVLVGDGFCVYHDGRRYLEQLIAPKAPAA